MVSEVSLICPNVVNIKAKSSKECTKNEEEKKIKDLSGVFQKIPHTGEHSSLQNAWIKAKVQNKVIFTLYPDFCPI